MVLSDSYEPVFAFNTKKSGVAQLVRTACKVFHVRGRDEAVVASYFNSYLAGQSEKCHFTPFIGNRFNILFYNAAALYCHADSIKDFIKKFPNPNNLIKVVQEDITNAKAGAFGIIDKILTASLWRIIESKSTISDLNPVLLRLKLDLSSLCKDSSTVFVGFRFFGDTDIEFHEDRVFAKLFADVNEDFDILTQHAIEVVFHAFLIILERQCVDQLPGAKYWLPSDLTGDSSTNVPTTNKASESDFAILDLLLKTEPNARMQTLLSLTMWARNHTLEWLSNKDTEEKDRILNLARVKNQDMKEKYKDNRSIETEEKRKNTCKTESQIK